MGNSESNQNITSSLKSSPNFKFLEKLFEDNSTTREGCKIVSKDSFIAFFGQNPQLANLCYNHFLATAKDQNETCSEMGKFAFTNGFDILLKLEIGTQHLIEHYFEVFSEGKQELSKQDLKQLLPLVQAVQLPSITSASLEQESLSDESCSTEALVKSLLCKGTDSVSKDLFVRQVFELLPRLFNGVHWWILRSLSKLEGSNQITLHHKKCPKIQLLTDSSPSDNILDEVALWILSVSIPPLFLSHQQASKHDECLNCLWKIIYDSNEHGLSQNRFKYHCFSYRGPTSMVVLLANKQILVLTLDTEWRESSKCFGGENTRLYQLHPDFKLLGEKNIVLYNEKSRGLPFGLSLGNNPAKPVVSLLDGLTLAKINYLQGVDQQENVERLVVWGCAGVKADDDQKQQQKWERRQAEQLQKVKLPGKWDENPDKALLQMAGVTTEHAQR